MSNSNAPAVSDAPIRVLVVDDQPLIRRGMSMILSGEGDINVVGQAADGAEAIAQVKALQPDVVLMDLHMPGTGGVVATREIVVRFPAVKVMILTTFDTDQLVFDAVCAGASAYLLKDASEAEVLETIRAVRRGESRLTSHIASKVLEQFRQMALQGPASSHQQPTEAPLPAVKPEVSGESTRPEGLTDKEARVLELIAEGMSNKQIAGAVYLAEGTVKNYVSRIMEKLHANTRTELAVMHVARRRSPE